MTILFFFNKSLCVELIIIFKNLNVSLNFQNLKCNFNSQNSENANTLSSADITSVLLKERVRIPHKKVIKHS